MTPTRAKVGDTVRIIVQGFQVGPLGVSERGTRLKMGENWDYLGV